MALTDAQIRAMGFDLPTGTDLIRNGDDNISKNARETANRFYESFLGRGILPNGADFNEYRLPIHRGAWRMPPANSYLNGPPAHLMGTQSGQFICMPAYGNGDSGTQLILWHDAAVYRTMPFQNWGSWRPFGGTGTSRDLTGNENLDDLETGYRYRLLYTNHAAQLGLPVTGVIGTIDVIAVTATRSMQIYTVYPGAVGSGGAAQYQVWTRGMDDNRVYLEWEKQAGGTGTGAPVQPVLASRAYSVLDKTSPVFDKTGSTPDRPASTMKMLAVYTARTLLTTTTLLNQTVTTTAADENPGGSGGVSLTAGSIISYRDLIYAAMLPSSNWATQVLARACGERMSGTGDGVEKFLNAMRAVAETRGWTGAVIDTAHGLGNVNRLSTAHLVDLLYMISNDAFLVEVMGSSTRDIQITGTNARTQTITHTINPRGAVEIPEFVAGKTGTLGTHTCLAMLWEQDGVMHAAALMGSTAARRFSDMRRIIDLTKTRIDEQYLLPSPGEYRFRGVLPDGTDLDTLYGLEHAGWYRLPGGSNYPNDPINTAAAGVLEVLPTDTRNAAKQVRTAQLETAWREANLSLAGGGMTWGTWQIN